MPRLSELEASFVALLDGGSFRILGPSLVNDGKRADGLWFLCPLCFKANLAAHGRGSYGTHHVLCWFDNVPPGIDPKPGRWTPQGTSIEDVTFVPAHGRSQSVALKGGCAWHGFVKDGAAD
jgi:hypothetical protein